MVFRDSIFAITLFLFLVLRIEVFKVSEIQRVYLFLLGGVSPSPSFCPIISLALCPYSTPPLPLGTFPIQEASLPLLYYIHIIAFFLGPITIALLLLKI